MTSLQVGQVVTKPNGYRFNGVVVAAFETVAGKPRIVVDNGDGLLHIFAETQLEATVDPEVVAGLGITCWCGRAVMLNKFGHLICRSDLRHNWQGSHGDNRTVIVVGRIDPADTERVLAMLDDPSEVQK